MAVNIVGKEIIDILVTALVEKAEQLPKTGQQVLIGILRQDEMDEIRRNCNELGQRLWAVNYESYNNRYDEHNETPEYVFESHHRAPAEVLAAVELYEYQISEASDPAGNEACDKLRGMLVRRLPIIEEAMKKIRQYA